MFTCGHCQNTHVFLLLQFTELKMATSLEKSQDVACVELMKDTLSIDTADTALESEAPMTSEPQPNNYTAGAEGDSELIAQQEASQSSELDLEAAQHPQQPPESSTAHSSASNITTQSNTSQSNTPPDSELDFEPARESEGEQLDTALITSETAGQSAQPHTALEASVPQVLEVHSQLASGHEVHVHAPSTSEQAEHVTEEGTNSEVIADMYSSVSRNAVPTETQLGATSVESSHAESRPGAQMTTSSTARCQELVMAEGETDAHTAVTTLPQSGVTRQEEVGTAANSHQSESLGGQELDRELLSSAALQPVTGSMTPVDPGIGQTKRRIVVPGGAAMAQSPGPHWPVTSSAGLVEVGVESETPPIQGSVSSLQPEAMGLEHEAEPEAQPPISAAPLAQNGGHSPTTSPSIVQEGGATTTPSDVHTVPETVPTPEPHDRAVSVRHFSASAEEAERERVGQEGRSVISSSGPQTPTPPDVQPVDADLERATFQEAASSVAPNEATGLELRGESETLPQITPMLAAPRAQDGGQHSTASVSTLQNVRVDTPPDVHEQTIPETVPTLEPRDSMPSQTHTATGTTAPSSTPQWVTFEDTDTTSMQASTEMPTFVDAGAFGGGRGGEGFGCSFLQSPPDELFCPICCMVAKQPQQTTCCGRIYCSACLKEYMKRSNKCPTCRQDVVMFKDLVSERRIKNLHVSCENKRNGCKWMGKLRELSDHVAQCDFTMVTCSNEGCSKHLFRHMVEQHVTSECQYRNFACPHCDAQGPYHRIVGEHLQTCTRLPIPCPNADCEQMVPRDGVSVHRETCPKQKVPCPYAHIGCTVEVPRDAVERHKEEAVTRHLDLAVGLLGELREKPEEEQYAPLVFRLPQFEQHWTSGQWWYSPAFYTHRGGYRMCLGVKVRGHKEGENTHTSVYVLLMAGKNDDNLVWPFRGEVEIEILNQLENRNHYGETIAFTQSAASSCNSRVAGAERSEKGLGSPFFIPHDQLGVSRELNRQYLKNDCIHFKVKRVAVFESNQPWLGDTLQGIQASERDLKESVLETHTPPIVLCMTHFHQVKAKSKCWLSTPFYTHFGGYKMCLSVYPNGVREGAGTHVSVYAYLMKGKNDANLVWPFRGEITLELLNQKENRAHHKGVMRFSDLQANPYNSRVIDGERGLGFGMTKFIPHDQLRGSGSTHYLRGDCLYFRVLDVNIFPTNRPWLSATKNLNFPTQAIQRIIQSTQKINDTLSDSCVPPRVYKMEGYEQLRTAGREWFAPSFYSHRGGYKMCLAVVPGGNDLGTGTHMSVYVHLERGKNDELLHWPFMGEVVFEILNQSSDSNHYRGVIKYVLVEETICNARVVNVDRSPGGMGYDTFITHDKLRNTRNCVFLKDDCVFFRVSKVTVQGQKAWLLPTD